MPYAMTVQDAPDAGRNTRIERGFGLDTTHLCRAMLDLGMAHASPVPQFPDGDHLDRSDFRDGEAVTYRARAYVQALELVRVDHGSHGDDWLPGIPVHKLASGDDWHVTAQECTEALAAYESATGSGALHPAAFADDLVPFLRTAARHGGFRVH
ncbi:MULTISPECIES: hypothetical protein [Actinosynnema]|uniref:hypothetical protein n=1 Tax=Actinosynnema TaxID=40566 RepID=UPI0020A5119E|nr:hypothetical protein [Actinosynnema pretiosum]MCP2097484.1 hypothetical protein [Actinosynnema pretiosum]